MLDLSFGLPIVVRDAALKMVAPGPESSINREYYAQENEREIEEGRGGLEEYGKTDEKARELLRRLANSEPYYKRKRNPEAGRGAASGGGNQTVDGEGQRKRITAAPGPIRTHQDTRRGGGSGRNFRGDGAEGTRGGRFPGVISNPPGPQDILPPRDPNILTLFISGVEDDLPEHAIRTFFTPFGDLRSLICSHRSHCAFVNYATRAGAEAAAAHCQGRAVISGCPLKVQWGKPRPLDNMDKDERIAIARQGRDTAKAMKALQATQGSGAFRGFAFTGGNGLGLSERGESSEDLALVAPPPGQEDVKYASLAGN